METTRNRNAIILILGVFSLLTGLSGASTNLALPEISRQLAISNNASTWIVQTGLMTTTILLVLFGYLGDQLSKERVFFWGGIFFTAGSLIDGLSLNFLMLLFGRIVQAVGGGMILATSMGLTSDNALPGKRGEAIATVSLFMNLGNIAGPSLGGLILGAASWRWIFLINVPAGLILMVLTRKIFAFSPLAAGQTKRVLQEANWTGQFLFMGGIVLFFVSTLFLHQTGQMWLGLAMLVIGLVVTIYSFFQDDHAPHPWIEPSVLHNRGFMATVTILLFAMLINMISNILLPFYLQSFLGLPAAKTGLIIGVQSVVMAFITPVAGFLADRINSHWLTLTGLSILAISQAAYVFYGGRFNWWVILTPIVLNGVGLGLFLSPNNSLGMSFISKAHSGVAGSLNSFFRTLGMTIGNSFGATLLFSQLGHVKVITPTLGLTFLTAFRNVFILATILSLIALLLGILSLKTTKQPTT
ncbi:MFS transporter [Enterococcus sp. CSURQ0835]|uniref:MFS transporter n=1 Tax=Enterococcus sp. CSURQ0835 TaxID=2681394 RepID=UPI00135B2282|nr:MFS transporter [Enterococcus sp. CSURQ0835]